MPPPPGMPSPDGGPDQGGMPPGKKATVFLVGKGFYVQFDDLGGPDAANDATSEAAPEAGPTPEGF